MSDLLQGQCLCGAVRFTFQQERPGVDACHCRMCQQWAGAPLLTLRGIKPEALMLTGEEHVTRLQVEAVTPYRTIIVVGRHW